MYQRKCNQLEQVFLVDAFDILKLEDFVETLDIPVLN